VAGLNDVHQLGDQLGRPLGLPGPGAAVRCSRRVKPSRAFRLMTQRPRRTSMGNPGARDFLPSRHGGSSIMGKQATPPPPGGKPQQGNPPLPPPSRAARVPGRWPAAQSTPWSPRRRRARNCSVTCSGKSPPASPTAARAASALPGSRPQVAGGLRRRPPTVPETRRHHLGALELCHRQGQRGVLGPGGTGKTHLPAGLGIRACPGRAPGRVRHRRPAGRPPRRRPSRRHPRSRARQARPRPRRRHGQVSDTMEFPSGTRAGAIVV
jgi:hypothetical protein